MSKVTPEKKSPNYKTMKEDDLKDLIKRYELDEADYTNAKGLNRQKLSNILKLIDVQTGQSNVAVVSDDEGVRDLTPKTKLNGTVLSGMMIEIEFFNSDENDLPYVQLALQGTAITIPRERKLWIPKEFMDGCLKHTVTTKMKMNVSRDGKISYIPKAVPRFQYTVHGILHIDELKKKAIEGKGTIES